MSTLVAQEVSAAVRLNLGCGDHRMEGYENIDLHDGRKAYPLTEYADNSVDEIYASHVLEHFGHRDTGRVLDEWVRVLKPGGVLRLAVPDFGWTVGEYMKGDTQDPLLHYIMGSQADANDFHGNIFDRNGLTITMSRAGLVGIAPWKSERKDCASLPCSLNLMGIKPVVKDWGTLCSVVMSMPRLAFADNMNSLIRLQHAYQMPFARVTGAYYHQCMERALMSVKTDYVLCVDYDTVFEPWHFERLMNIIEGHPEIDAIAPLQKRREENELLAYAKDFDLTKIHGESMPVDHAHFGLTVIRTAALEKMKHPWFEEIPDDEGWGPKRCDADVNFWRKFKAAGNALHLAPRVGVGHLELMVCWVGEDFAPTIQSQTQYAQHGPPVNIRR